MPWSKKGTNQTFANYKNTAMTSHKTSVVGTFRGKNVIGIITNTNNMTQTIEYDDGSSEVVTSQSGISMSITYPTTSVSNMSGSTVSNFPSGPPTVTINVPTHQSAWTTGGYSQMTIDEIYNQPQPKTTRELLDVQLIKLKVPSSAVELLETNDPGNGSHLSNPIFGFACEYCGYSVEGFINIHFTAKAFSEHWKNCDER